jgi:hypothetical protein
MRVGRGRCCQIPPSGVVRDEPRWLGRIATVSTNRGIDGEVCLEVVGLQVFVDGVAHESLAVAVVELAELHRSHRGRSTWRTAASVGSQRQSSAHNVSEGAPDADLHRPRAPASPGDFLTRRDARTSASNTVD